ncbi:MFS transporter, partial [Pseudomonas sp. MWU12-2534b]
GDTGRRGERVSWQMASQGGATLVGAFVALTLSRALPPEALHAWGWRVPFVLGLLIGPVGFYLRRHLDDTLPHAAAGAPRERASVPWRQVVAGTLLVIGGTSTTYTIVFFLPSFLTLTVGMPASVSLLSGCAAGAVLLIGSPLAGRLA